MPLPPSDVREQGAATFELHSRRPANGIFGSFPFKSEAKYGVLEVGPCH